MKNEKLEQAEQERHALLQMYQAGFYDGKNWGKMFKDKFDKRFKDQCIKAFNIRFVDKVAPKLKEVKKNG